MAHKPDGNKKNPDGSQKLLTCAQEGTSEIGEFLMLKTGGKQTQKIYWTYDVLFEVRSRRAWPTWASLRSFGLLRAVLGHQVGLSVGYLTELS